jgi:hypothetical protein
MLFGGTTHRLGNPINFSTHSVIDELGFAVRADWPRHVVKFRFQSATAFAHRIVQNTDLGWFEYAGAERIYTNPFANQPLGRISCWLYPLVTGDHPVTITCEAGHPDRMQTWNSDQVLRVIEPEIKMVDVRGNVTTASVYREPPPKDGTVDKYDWTMMLGDGGRDISKSGFGVLFEVTAADGAHPQGEVGIFQIIRGLRRDFGKDTVYETYTRNQWCLDHEIPLRRIAIPAEGNPRPGIELPDSPKLHLADGLTKVTVDENFQTFVAYKPNLDHSVWIPLGYVDWGWNATAERPLLSSGLRGPWRVAKPEAAYHGKFHRLRTIEPPTWRGQIQALARRPTPRPLEEVLEELARRQESKDGDRKDDKAAMLT